MTVAEPLSNPLERGRAPKPGARQVPADVASRYPAAGAAFMALILHCVAYRIAIAHALAARATLGTLGMFGWDSSRPELRVLGAGLRDVPIAVALCGIIVAATVISARRPRAFALFGNVLVALVLLAIGLMSAANLRMTLDLGTGLDLPSLFEAGTVIAGADVNDYVGWKDLLLATSPVLLFLAFRSVWTGISSRLRRGMRSTLVLGLLVAAGLPPGWYGIWPIVRDLPAWRVFQEAALRSDLGLEALPRLEEDAQGRPGFIDPALVVPEGASASSASPVEPLGRAGPNVLLVVLESTSWRELAPPSHPGLDPMPLLHQMAREGWWLDEHRTTANDSPEAAFALFTGIVSAPSLGMSVTSSRLDVPALWSRLGGRDEFLVTAARLDGYFPLGLVRNDGLSEITDYFALASPTARPHADGAMNELDSLDALVGRIERTRGHRFFGTYWADAPHGPYFDQDPEHRLISEPANDLERYLNCLSVVDRELGVIVAALRNAGHGDDTLLIVVADHGEAFGEHGTYAHGRSSWEEIEHVPALLWQPGAIEPRDDHRWTSHVDLAPTILDALGIPFDPLDFQGESLYRPTLHRRYIFANGREGVLVSWDRDGNKLAWNYYDGSCVAFELGKDPDEQQRLRCDRFSEQLLALKRFDVAQGALEQRLERRRGAER